MTIGMLGWWETFWLGLALGLGIRFATVVVQLVRVGWDWVEAFLASYAVSRWPHSRD